jgi:hypothetical protein
MTVRYYSSHGELCPEYRCQKFGIEHGLPPCQRILGRELDRAVGELMVETVSPLALEVALAVQEELQARAEETDRLRRQQVERARYEAELAQRRYLRVDPDNRLVADSLEADWNQKLRAMAIDFPLLWRDPATPHRERKRMVHLLLQDVTLIRTEEVVAHVRFRGGATRTLRLPLPRNAWQLRQMDPAVVREIDGLLNDHTDGEVAEILNARGLRPGVADRFSSLTIRRVRRKYGLEDRFARLRQQGLPTLKETAAALGLHPETVKKRASRGRLASVVYNDKGSASTCCPLSPGWWRARAVVRLSPSAGCGGNCGSTAQSPAAPQPGRRPAAGSVPDANAFILHLSHEVQPDA